MAFNEEIARASIVLQVSLDDAQINQAAQRAANNFNTQFARLQKQFQTGIRSQQVSAVSALSNAFGGLASNVAIVTPRINSLRTSLQNFGTQGNRTAGVIGSLSLGLAGIGVAAVAVGAKFAQIAGDFQELEQSLGAIIDNSITADTTTERFVGQIRALAIESGRSSLQLANTGRQFLALGFSGNKAIEVVESFTKAASLTGATNEQLRLALNGVTQIASKGAVAMEELRRQIAENLP